MSAYGYLCVLYQADEKVIHQKGFCDCEGGVSKRNDGKGKGGNPLWGKELRRRLINDGTRSSYLPVLAVRIVGETQKKEHDIISNISDGTSFFYCCCYVVTRPSSFYLTPSSYSG